MDKQDIQAVLTLIAATWPRAGKNFGEVQQRFLVDRIKNLRVDYSEAYAVVGEVYVTTKSFGGVCVEDIYKRFKAISDNKHREATVYRAPHPPQPIEEERSRRGGQSFREYYTDPAHPERLEKFDEKTRAFLLEWKRTGVFPSVIKSQTERNDWTDLETIRQRIIARHRQQVREAEEFVRNEMAKGKMPPIVGSVGKEKG